MASEYLKWKYRDVKPDEPSPELTGKEKLANWFHYSCGAGRLCDRQHGRGSGADRGRNGQGPVTIILIQE